MTTPTATPTPPPAARHSIRYNGAARSWDVIGPAGNVASRHADGDPDKGGPDGRAAALAAADDLDAAAAEPAAPPMPPPG